MPRLPFAALLLATALSAQSPLATTFAHNSASLPGGAVYFDLTVLAAPLTITRLDLNLSGAGVVEIYTKSGSRTGAVTSPGAWTLTGIGVITGALPGLPTPVNVNPFVLAPGTHGVAIRAVGIQQFFTVGTGGNQNYTNADLALAAGESTMALFAPPVIAPRVVNTRIHYLVGEVVAVPAHGSILAGHSRGYRVAAQTSFNIRQLALPPQAFAAGCTASYLLRLNGTIVYRSVGNTGAVSPNLHVSPGDVVDVIGCWSPPSPGPLSARNSIPAASGPDVTTIRGVNHIIEPIVWSWDIGDPNWTASGSTGALSLVFQSHLGRVLMTTEVGVEPATNTTLGQGCGGSVGSVHEYFANGGDFDLDQSAVTLTPNAGGGYTLSRLGALLPVGATGIVAPLAMGDDSEMTVPFTIGSFPGWTGVTICANGFVSQASGNGTGYFPSVGTLLAAQQTAFWSWHDFDPTRPGSGQVKMEQSPAVTVITWDGVWDWAGTSVQNASTVQFQLYANGAVTIAWGGVSTVGGAHLVGYSPGGPSPNPGSTDLSALGIGTIVLSPTEVGTLTLAALSVPAVGATWNLVAQNVPPTTVLGIDVLGLADPGIDDLAMIGMPGCGLRASLDSVIGWFSSGTSHARSLVIPNILSLRGIDVFAATAVFLSPAPNAFGALTSNGVHGHIGDL